MCEPLNGTDRSLYIEALTALNDSGVPYMLGGAFAVYHYTNWWRHTHDVDVYVTPEDKQAAVQALRSVGFADLGEQAGGDVDWIYHLGKDSIVVDVIWRFANLVEYISPDWFDRASRGTFLGLDAKFLPLEELIWIKMFVINRHRCDWPDIFRIIRAQCCAVDWERLLELTGEHWLLLGGLIDVFDWQHPMSRECIPRAVRDEISERRRNYKVEAVDIEREHLLDPWIRQRADVYATGSNEQPDGGHRR